MKCQISELSYQALQSVYYSTAGWDWSWNLLDPKSIWYFPSNLSDPCSDSWQGVTCVELSGYSSNCTISGLSLPYFNLKGYLPTELGDLVNLDYLDFDSNLLNGSIPTELGYLTSLTSLSLYINSLSGSIPTELGYLTSLTSLALYANSLSGSIPTQLGYLTRLTSLYIYVNSLSGLIPTELGYLTKLTYLVLNTNSLSGSIPTELSYLSSLTYLSLYANSLSGSIPTELSYLTSLTKLYLDTNSLSSSIPTELGYLTRLITLDLDTNSLSGSLPIELWHLTSLSYLDLGINLLSGLIPTEVGYLTSLTFFSLYANSLSGSIPTEVGNLDHIYSLFFNANFLSGTMPTQLGTLSHLLYLLLSSNFLRGSIPTELGRISALSYVEINANLLTGNIPTELGQLTHLEVLYLYSNCLHGSLSTQLANARMMSVFDVSDNSLTGTVPLAFTNWSKLYYSNISRNGLSGSIDAFSESPSLISLDCSSNHFSGTIPASLFSLPSIQSIILSQNCFSGSLPSTMCGNPVLEHVVLDLLTAQCGWVGHGVLGGTVLRRYMSGTIPSCVWNSSSLITLHLLGNGLQGSLSELAWDSVLSVVALGSNQLTGTIPTSFQRHPFTQLYLAVNRLTGTLLADVAVDSNTTQYDVSTNRLSGDLPAVMYSSAYVGVFSALEGNLFQCQQRHMPSSGAQQQQQQSSYGCGSTDLEQSLAEWLIGVICICALCGVGVWFGLGTALMGVRVLRATIFQRAEFISILIGPLCCLVICVFGLVGYVIMKLASSSNSTLLVTHTEQYWWTSTAAFMHDWVVAVVMTVLLLSGCGVLCLSLTALEHKTRAVSTLRLVLNMCVVLAHVVNIVVVGVVNGVYVLAVVDRLDSAKLLMVQTALALFKISWSSVAIPWLLSPEWTKVESSQQLSHAVFMMLFVFLGAPLASSFCESSSCFLLALTSPLPISYSLVTLGIDDGISCNEGICQLLATPVDITVAGQATPPWMYSYQCSSAVVTGYTPVLILSYFISAFVMPCIMCALWLLYPHLSSNVKALVPTHLLPMLEVVHGSDPSSVSSTIIKGQALLRFGRKLVIKYILNLAVMVTFGLSAPLLAIAVMCDTAVNIAAVLLLGRLLEAREHTDADVVAMRLQFWDGFYLSRAEIGRSIYAVIWFVSSFWAMFMFDWIADVHGVVSGGFSTLVPLLCPWLVGWLVLRMTRSPSNEQSMLVFPSMDGIEMTESPIMFPQQLCDGFDIAMLESSSAGIAEQPSDAKVMQAIDTERLST